MTNTDNINYPAPKQDQQYKVLVRCATFNHSKYIEDALNGFAIQQTNFPFICCILDDASTDGEQEVIKAWMERECDINKSETIDIPTSVVIIVPHKTNTSCTFAFYLLKQNLYGKGDKKLKHINPWREKCEYEALCEGDDYWIDPLKLQKQIDILEKNPNFTISFCKVQCISSDKKSILIQTMPMGNNIKTGIITLEDYIKEEFYYGYWTFQTSSFVFRTNLIPEYNIIRKKELKSFPYGDMPLLLFCLLKGNGFYHSEICSFYRVLSGGYNSNIELNKKYKISQEKKLITALINFNIYTNYKYNKSIKRKILRSNFIITSTKYGKITFFRPKYWCILLERIRYKFYSIKQKIKLHV